MGVVGRKGGSGGCQVVSYDISLVQLSPHASGGARMPVGTTLQPPVEFSICYPRGQDRWKGDEPASLHLLPSCAGLGPGLKRGGCWLGRPG